MNYQIIEREPFHIIGVKKLIDCNETFDQSKEISRMWAELGKENKLEHLLSLQNGRISGLIGATVNYDDEHNQIEYWIAVESNVEVSDELDLFHVPAAKWAIFNAVGPVIDVVPAMWKQIYSEWFPSNGYEHSGGPSVEVYKSDDPTSSTAETEIWIPVK